MFVAEYDTELQEEGRPHISCLIHTDRSVVYQCEVDFAGKTQYESNQMPRAKLFQS